jgi:hypothetical protein
MCEDFDTDDGVSAILMMTMLLVTGAREHRGHRTRKRVLMERNPRNNVIPVKRENRFTTSPQVKLSDPPTEAGKYKGSTLRTCERRYAALYPSVADIVRKYLGFYFFDLGKILL